MARSRSKISTNQGQIGVCYFEDNRQCEEWALMRGECSVGGVKVTGFVTEAGRYCAITGGQYTVTGNNGAQHLRDDIRSKFPGGNFLRYVRDGHYDGLIVHRVVPNLVVQTGGYDAKYAERPTRAAIPNESGNGLSNRRGSIGMARGESPHSATSQFYVNVKDNPGLNPLPSRWGSTVFGQVVEGMGVIDRIAYVPTGERAGVVDTPLTPIVIRRASVVGETAMPAAVPEPAPADAPGASETGAAEAAGGEDTDNLAAGSETRAREASVHMADFPSHPDAWIDDALDARWAALADVRRAVNEALEVARAAKTIGAPLTAHVTVSAGGDVFRLLQAAEADLPMLFIVSSMTLRDTSVHPLTVEVAHASGEKCPRCWRYVPALTAGEDGVCGRCAEAVGAPA